MSVTIQDNTASVKNDIETGIGLAIRLLLEDIFVEATPVTPMEKGDLRKRVLRKMEGNRKGSITWESSYAGVQEQGFRRTANGIVFFRNYTTPGTGPHYARDSVENIMTRLPEYLEKVGLV